MVELRITVGQNVTAVRRDNDATETGRIHLEHLDKQAIDVLVNVLRTDRMRRREELVVLGSLLYRTIFGGAIDGALVAALEAASDDTPLRLRLRFEDGCPVPWYWPWEVLHQETTPVREGFFLATRTKLTLSRFVGMAKVPQVPKREPPNEKLRVLSFISEGLGLESRRGQELGPIDTQDFCTNIDKLAERYPIRREGLINPDYVKLANTLVSFKPHVVHFIGYGRVPSLNQEPLIGLLHQNNRCSWAEPGNVAETFDGGFKPPVIVIHLVRPSRGADLDSEASWEAGSFAGLAEKLVRRCTHAAIATHYPIPPEAAVDFSRVLYQNLASGLPIEDAVQESRRILSNGIYRALSDHRGASDGQYFFEAPLLFSHHAEFPIMAAPRPAEPGPGVVESRSTLGLPRNL